MRKITPESTSHNTAPRGGSPFRFWLLAALILALGACSPDKGDGEKRNDSRQTTAGDCPVATETSAWTAFKDLADRVSAGEKVTKEEFDAYGNLPTVTLWRESLQPGSPPAHRVGNWLEGTFWQELGRQGQQKTSADRAAFRRRYRYNLANRDRIDEQLALLAGSRRCDIDELARYWIDTGNVPDQVTLHFLPGKPEIRITGESLLVDTGVVSAGSTDQVIRQIVSLLYRKFQFLPGGNPVDMAGETAVAHSFRVMLNEGVTGWIEKAVEMEFDGDHPELYKIRIIPEEFYQKAQDAVGMMNRQLGSMLDDESEMTEKGPAFALTLAGMNAFSQTGFAMSAVISNRFGDDRLREVRHSVPAFLAAYQEAALLNPAPQPVPGEPGVELFTTVPPLDPEIFTKLHALLTRVFPE